MRENPHQRLGCETHHVLQKQINQILILNFLLFFSPHYLLTQICITCCSSVMTVWTRKFPLSHGSVIPTEPGRKRPAASIWRQRLQYICSFYPKIRKKIDAHNHKQLVSNKQSSDLPVSDIERQRLPRGVVHDSRVSLWREQHYRGQINWCKCRTLT